MQQRILIDISVSQTGHPDFCQIDKPRILSVIIRTKTTVDDLLAWEMQSNAERSAELE